MAPRSEPIFDKLINRAIDSHKPSTSSLAYTIYSIYAQVRHNLTQGQPGQMAFNDLMKHPHDQFIPATSQPPPHRLTSSAVLSNCFSDESLGDIKLLVASVVGSQHHLAPTDSMVQYNVRARIEQKYPAVFKVFFSGHLPQANLPFTDVNSMWLHVAVCRTNKKAAISAWSPTWNTMPRSIGPVTRGSQPHHRIQLSSISPAARGRFPFAGWFRHDHRP